MLKKPNGVNLGLIGCGLEHFSDNVGNLGAVAGDGVTVEVKGVADLAVAKSFGDFNDGNTFSQKLGGVGVAQGVEMSGREAGFIQNFFPNLFYVLGNEVATGGGVEDISTQGPASVAVCIVQLRNHGGGQIYA